MLKTQIVHEHVNKKMLRNNTFTAVLIMFVNSVVQGLFKAIS